jgi:hypothetical protein
MFDNLIIIKEDQNEEFNEQIYHQLDVNKNTIEIERSIGYDNKFDKDHVMKIKPNYLNKLKEFDNIDHVDISFLDLLPHLPNIDGGLRYDYSRRKGRS